MSDSKAFEVNFDGLVGLTHNYGGLSYGNVASEEHQNWKSQPKKAALQGLEKMKFLMDLGFRQAILPPQERPDVGTLRKLGFEAKTDEQVIEKVSRSAPELLTMVCSASSMWAANAATVSPSADSHDGRVHFTPANLTQNFHRSLEMDTTTRVLQSIFSNEKYFAHHSGLPKGDLFSDEGAANHTRFCGEYGKAGIQFFVYGRGRVKDLTRVAKYPARQSEEASRTIARLHLLKENQVIFAQQNPDVIDEGVFHNDVISVGNQNLLLCHEMAFSKQSEVISNLKSSFDQLNSDREFQVVTIRNDEVSVRDAVKSYLFNTQLLQSPQDPNQMIVIAPEECREIPSVKEALQRLVEDSTILVSEVHYLDLRQSMQNGGGPACLRLRVVLSEREIQATEPGVFLTSALYSRLKAWVEKHYRDELSAHDLRDPQLLKEGRTALDELTQILGLKASIYPFQR